jgi:putative peptidoglycan lipid II flippase
MISRIVTFFSKKITGLHQAAYILGFFTFVSQILGLVRDRLLAYMFGAGRTVDVYYAAFKIPDLVLVVGGSVVSIAVLVPFLTRKITEDKQKAQRFIDAIFTAFFIGVTALSAVLFAVMPWLAPTVFPGISDPALQADLVLLGRMFLLSPILLGISNIFASIIQVYKRFLIYALSPILYNLGIIVGIVLLYPIFGVAGLGLGVVIGVALHAGVQIPFVAYKGFAPQLRWLTDMQPVWQVMRNSLPRTLTLSTNKLAILALVSLASVLAPGSIAIFNFSFNLQSAPMAIVGASYSLAAFPALSQYFVDGNHKKFIGEIETAVRHVLFWSLPIVALFVVLRAQIVRTVLGAGKFGWTATKLTAASLALFAIAVAAQSLVLVFVRSFYAADDTVTPLLTNIIGGLLIVGGAFGLTELFRSQSSVRYFLETLLRVKGVEDTAVLGLPLAYSLGTVVNAGLLWVAFRWRLGVLWSHVRSTMFQSAAGAIVAGFAAHLGLILLGQFLDLRYGPDIFLQGLGAGIVGIAAGALTLWLLDNDEFARMLEISYERFGAGQQAAGSSMDVDS